MHPTILLIVLFLGFSLATATGIFAWRDLTSRRHADIDQRLSQTTIPLAASTLDDGEDELVRGGWPLGRWFRRIMADSGLGTASREGVLLMLLVGTALGGSVFLWRDELPSAIVGGLAGMVATLVVLMFLASRRRAAILEQLPDVTDFLARSVRAGESIDQAIAAAGQTVPAPLRDEMRRCARQLDMGLSLTAALRNLVRRAPLIEVRLLATSLIVQRHSGGNLGSVLERLTFVFRDRLHYKRQYRSATAAARLSAMFIVAVSVFVACHAAIARPDEMREALEHPLGKVLLAVAILLEIVGITFTLFLLRNDY